MNVRGASLHLASLGGVVSSAGDVAITDGHTLPQFRALARLEEQMGDLDAKEEP